MGIKTATSLASQISLPSFHTETSCPASPHTPVDSVETSIVMLPVVVPTAGVTLDKPSPTGVRSKLHLRHDSVTSYRTPSYKTTSIADVGELDAILEEPLMLHIRDGGDVRAVPALAAALKLKDAEALQVRAMELAVQSGNPYMVRALLENGVAAKQAVKACATRAPLGEMQDILHLIDTRKPGREAWLHALFTAAGECKLRPFVDLLTFLKPRMRELTQGDETILHIAAKAGSFSAVCELLPRNLKPFACNSQGETPFDLAVAGNHHLVVKAFVEHPRTKAQLTQKMLDRYLDQAVHNGALAVARVIMQAGAKAGEPLLAVARKRFEDEMVEALQQNIQDQPVNASMFQKLKSMRLRKQPVMLSWHDLVDGPNVVD